MAVKKKIGTVISSKMTSTRIVLVKEKVFHKQYKKVILIAKRYPVQDIESASRLGDQVLIVKIPKISKTKSWRLQNIIKKVSN